MKPSIMIVNPMLHVYGGAERQIVELANYLTEQNHRVLVLTAFAVPEFKYNLKEARIMEAGTEQGLAQAVNGLCRKFDIVNAHNHPAELYCYYPYKPTVVWQCNEPPEVVLRGGIVNPTEKAYVRKMVKKAVVITDYDKERFNTVYGMDPVVNYPGVRYSFFAENVKTRNTLNMKDNFVMTQVGYFTWTKNQVKTVEIFNEVKKEVKDARLVLVGIGADRGYGLEVTKKIEELGLEDDVIINSYIQGDEAIRNIYRQSSVFVNPALSQGGWATSFEAMCVGVPTIVSDNFVASNLVTNNKLGRVVSIDDFAKSILDIHSNLAEEKKKTSENAKWIQDNLTWKKFGERYEQVFEEICQ